MEKKKVNKDFYTGKGVNFNGKPDKQGIIYSPYVLGYSSDEDIKKYNEFMDEYYKKHKYCPKCGHDGYTTTLMGYPLNMEHPEDYKDKNTAGCTKCGDVHLVHDRVDEKTMKEIISKL